jgi:hypothetical protein
LFIKSANHLLIGLPAKLAQILQTYPQYSREYCWSTRNIRANIAGERKIAFYTSQSSHLLPAFQANYLPKYCPYTPFTTSAMAASSRRLGKLFTVTRVISRVGQGSAKLRTCAS